MGHPAFAPRKQPRVGVVEHVRTLHSWVPGAYWAFLAQVGYGQLAGLCFYEGVTQLQPLGLREGPADFVAFADDMSGCFYGFLEDKPNVVTLDSCGWEVDDTGQVFDVFLR